MGRSDGLLLHICADFLVSRNGTLVFQTQILCDAAKDIGASFRSNDRHINRVRCDPAQRFARSYVLSGGSLLEELGTKP